MAYHVLVGDLIESRRAPARRELAVKVEVALAGLRERFAGAWRAPMVTTRGLDEASSVLADPSVALDVAFAVNLELWPQRFRFALGAGGIDVRLGTGDAAAMDGAAFHHAAAGLARIEKTGGVFAVEGAGIERVSGAVVEAAAHLVGTLMSGWTETEAHAVRAYRDAGTQAGAAERLGVSQPTVSAALKRAHHSEIELALGAVRGWLVSLRD